MLLKTATARRHKPSLFAACLYRLPLYVTERLLFANGDSYPICPRCGSAVDREYMHFCDQCGQRLAWELFGIAHVVHAPRRRPMIGIENTACKSRRE